MEDYFEMLQTIGVFSLIISVIVFITIILIAQRLKAIKESNETLVKIMALEGVKSGALTSRICADCKNEHYLELIEDESVCPACDFSYRKGNKIMKHKHNKEVISFTPDYIEKHKSI